MLSETEENRKVLNNNTITLLRFAPFFARLCGKKPFDTASKNKKVKPISVISDS